MVSTLSSFQSQLASIMESLMKTAVMEISKLVDMECKVLQSEVSRSRSEICDLRKRLKLLELQTWTARGQRQIQEDVRTNTAQTDHSKSNHYNYTDECHARTQTPAYVKRECGQEESHNPLNMCRASVPFRDTPTKIHGEQGECKKSMDSPQQQCGINQPINIIKNEAHEMKCWDNGEEGSCVAHYGEDLSPSPIKDAVSYVDKRSQENETAKLPSIAESIQTKINVLPKKTTVNQGLSSNTCTSEMDHSSFSRPQGLSRSVRTCSDAFSADKHFVCLYCSKRFRCFSQLEVHQRSHTGEKPYRCTLCGKRYTQKGHLYTHQRTHTGEKPYRCLLCGKGFIQKCTLDMHLRSHTGEKPFTCTKCGKGFTKKCNLNKHLSCQSCNSRQ